MKSVSGGISPQQAGIQIPGNYQFLAMHHGHPVQRVWHRAKLELISALIPELHDIRILDIGCGSGVVSNFLAEHGAKVTGIDLNQEAIRFARSQFNKPNLEFFETSVFDYKQDGYDLIVCLEFIEHFPEHVVIRLLRHLGKLSTTNGRLLLSTPNYGSFWRLLEWALDFFDLVPRLRGDQHLCELTSSKLNHMLAESGWRPIEMGSFNGLAPFFAFLCEKHATEMQRRILFSPERRSKRYRNLLYAYCCRC